VVNEKGAFDMDAILTPDVCIYTDIVGKDNTKIYGFPFAVRSVMREFFKQGA
jgi:hypothetical protein